MARGKPERQKSINFQVRMKPELVAAFDAMLEGMATGGAVNADDDPLNRTDLVGYWARWITALPPEEQRRWADAYRDDHMEQIRRGRGAASGAAIKGGHTVGRVRSLDDGIEPGKPGRPKRNKMDAQAAR
jgi:hypothetical protein